MRSFAILAIPWILSIAGEQHPRHRHPVRQENTYQRLIKRNETQGGLTEFLNSLMDNIEATTTSAPEIVPPTASLTSTQAVLVDPVKTTQTSKVTSAPEPQSTTNDDPLINNMNSLLESMTSKLLAITQPTPVTEASHSVDLTTETPTTSSSVNPATAAPVTEASHSVDLTTETPTTSSSVNPATAAPWDQTESMGSDTFVTGSEPTSSTNTPMTTSQEVPETWPTTSNVALSSLKEASSFVPVSTSTADRDAATPSELPYAFSSTTGSEDQTAEITGVPTSAPSYNQQISVTPTSSVEQIPEATPQSSATSGSSTADNTTVVVAASQATVQSSLTASPSDLIAGDNDVSLTATPAVSSLSGATYVPQSQSNASLTASQTDSSVTGSSVQTQTASPTPDNMPGLSFVGNGLSDASRPSSTGTSLSGQVFLGSSTSTGVSQTDNGTEHEHTSLTASSTGLTSLSGPSGLSTTAMPTPSFENTKTLSTASQTGKNASESGTSGLSNTNSDGPSTTQTSETRPSTAEPLPTPVSNNSSSRDTALSTSTSTTTSTSNTSQTLILPATILTQTSTSQTSQTSSTTASATIPSNPTPQPLLPAAIAPAEGIVTPNSTQTIIEIGFGEALNYPFVVSSALSTAQIFAYLPRAVSSALNISTAQVTSNSLRPYAKATYNATVAYLVIPNSLLGQLEELWDTPSSALYHQADASVQSLVNLIDVSIPLLLPSTKGASVGSGSGSNKDSDSPSTPSTTSSTKPADYGSLAQTGPSTSTGTKSATKIAGIGVGAAAGAGAYATLMFALARRYRNQRARRFSRVSTISGGVAVMTTRFGNDVAISAPMNPENSLGI